MDTKSTNRKSRILGLLTVLVLMQFQLSNGQGQGYEGDSCTLQGDSGSCKIITNCPEAIKALRERGQRPKICGFSNSLPIVCCVSGSQPISQPTPGPTRRPPVTQTPVRGGVGEKSRQKCIEYSDYVYEWVAPPTQVLSSNKIKVNRCAHVAVELVIGGENTQPREFPHMALLGYGSRGDKSWLCGGTLISDEFVLTAGHCLYSPQVGEVRWVRLGENNIQNPSETEVQDFEVAESIKHPQYRAPSRYNDIALLRLDRKAQLNKFVIPACLHVGDQINNDKAIATGWGTTRTFGTTSQDLMKVVLELFTIEECNATYAAAISTRKLKNGILPETQLCAGHHSEEKDTCQGDSGGPLQNYLSNPYCMYDIIGVTSFGSACGVIGSPGVYTRVSAYTDWIESVVWPN